MIGRGRGVRTLAAAAAPAIDASGFRVAGRNSGRIPLRPGTSEGAMRREAAVLRARWVGWIAVILAIAATALGVARLAAWTANYEVSFDGAMNLEVARSLAEGDGYRRLYADRSGFSHEIQSRAPYILPAAAIIAAFGVGVWQAQLANFLYVLALLGVVFVLVRRVASWQWGLVAAAVCLWTPGLREFAMNGYGEVPALAWWLASLVVLMPRAGASFGTARFFAAGLLAGIAVLTKTVLAIGLVAMAPLLVAAIVAHDLRVRAVLVALFAFGVGVALPALIYEIAHVAAIGDVARWGAWLNDEIRAIHMQAGTHDGFRDTQGIGSKLVVHSQLLADNLGLPAPLLMLWIGGTLALAWFGRRGLASAPARAALLSLALFAAIYFVWWLGFTPTEKAWFRRIFNGVLALETVLVALLGALSIASRDSCAKPSRGVLAASALLAALAVPILRAGSFPDVPPDNPDAASLREDLAALAQVPTGAKVYGAGWYSAPTLAFYSGRRFGNLMARTPDELAAESPVYLVLDSAAMHANADDYWLSRYAHRDLARSAHAAIIEIDARAPLDPFADAPADQSTLRNAVDFHATRDYPHLFGFQDPEGDGWRWVAADAAVGLRYGGEHEFFVDIYLPALASYRFDHGVGITAWIGDCRLGAFRQNESRRERWFLPMNCPVESGRRVTVRLVSDNLIESRDERPLGYIVNGLGFADGVERGDSAQR
jgi:hypothetical protein